MCVDVNRVLKGTHFMTFMGFLPNHPLYSNHGFVFCFINLPFLFMEAYG